ncbi:unnamed protein product [Alopecurus aequalis]
MALSAPPSQEEPTQLPAPGKQFSSQLAAAVRSINWSYGIFWSISTSRPGVLTWKDGFYNGKVKTRKIANFRDRTADELLMQSSQQLRELYESLLSGECDHRARRPTASLLSPEDLADAEWYYTVSMTYAFRPGQGLPGQSLASNQHIWLCNAQFADTKTFQRALLAEVLEDEGMVSRVGTSFWELQFLTLTCSESKALTSSPSADDTGEADIVFEELDHTTSEALILGEIECLSNGNPERITKEIDELYGLCEELDVRPLEDNWVMGGSFGVMYSPEAPVVPHANEITDDVVTLGIPVESSRQSCFMGWKRASDSVKDVNASVAGESQKFLKKVVTGGEWTSDRGGGIAIAQESNVKRHVMTERRRREKLNEMFLILKWLVPSIQKVDKASILAETIAYLKELQLRIGELESSRAPTRPITTETRSRKRHDVARKKFPSAGSKRKASELGEREQLSKDDGASNIVNVTVMEKEVLVEVQCRWKELLMMRVFDALKALGLDVLSVQSSTPDGLLDIKIRAQYVGSIAMAPGMISEALQKAIAKR